MEMNWLPPSSLHLVGSHVQGWREEFVSFLCLVSIGFERSRHTPRYSISSSPIYSNFQMTTFKTKNVFLVFSMGHTMIKLTYECKKIKKFKSLVDLQCKCVRLDTPRIGPIWGFPAVA